jgi:hypothetical protein
MRPSASVCILYFLEFGWYVVLCSNWYFDILYEPWSWRTDANCGQFIARKAIFLLHFTSIFLEFSHLIKLIYSIPQHILISVLLIHHSIWPILSTAIIGILRTFLFLFVSWHIFSSVFTYYLFYSSYKLDHLFSQILWDSVSNILGCSHLFIFTSFKFCCNRMRFSACRLSTIW